MLIPLTRYVNNFIDSFKSVEPEVLACYQQKMPETIQVNFRKDKNGCYVTEITGIGEGETLYTQAKNQDELEDMVNDAIATYYDVPFRYAKFLLINKRYLNPNNCSLVIASH